MDKEKKKTKFRSEASRESELMMQSDSSSSSSSSSIASIKSLSKTYLKSQSEVAISFFKEPVHFCTGSCYKGEWKPLGMHGVGKFLFFYGVKYFGYMHYGEFHKYGTLYYPNGARIEGVWKTGEMVKHRYLYSDNLVYDPENPYCQSTDRRFWLEIQYGINPAGRSLKTNNRVSKTIPAGCYDTLDGFYDPKKKYIFDANNHKKIVRIPTDEEHEKIVNKYRKAGDQTLGYRPQLYDNWSEESVVLKEQFPKSLQYFKTQYVKKIIRHYLEKKRMKRESKYIECRYIHKESSSSSDFSSDDEISESLEESSGNSKDNETSP